MCALGSSQRRMASGLAHGKAHAAFRRAVWARACVPGRLREHARGFPACCGRTGFLVWRGRKVYTFHRLCAHAAPCAPAACAAALCGAKCKKGGLWIFPQAAFCACKRGKARFCAPQGRLYRAARRLAHARWQAFTSSTMGMTHNASPSATVYSAMLICVKPKASEMPGR